MSSSRNTQSVLSPEFLLEVLFRRKRVVIISTIVVLAFAAAGILVLPKKYQATTKLILNATDPKNPVGSRPLGDEVIVGQIKALTQFLQSEATLQECINRVGAESVLADLKSLTVAQAAKALAKQITIEVDATYTFSISAEMGNPDLAYRIAQVLGDQLREWSVKTNLEPTSQATSVYKNTVDEVQGKISADEVELKTLKEKQRDTLPVMQTYYISQREKFQELLLGAQVELEKLRAEREHLQQRIKNDVSLRVDVDSPASKQLLEARIELSALMATHRETHPDVQRVKKRIADLERTLTSQSSETSNGGVILSTAYRTVETRLKDVSSAVASYERALPYYQSEISRLSGLMAKIPETERKQVELEDRLKQNKDILARITTEYAGAQVSQKIVETGLGWRFDVIQNPVRPMAPKSTLLLMIAAGLMVGPLLGIILAFTFEFFDPVIHRPGDVELYFDLPVLSKIPEVTSR